MSSVTLKGEHGEQVALIQWAGYLKEAYPALKNLHSIPNGAYLGRSGHGHFSLQALALKDEGLLPGVCDLFLPAARHGFHGLYIEMKWGKNKPSPEQIAFIEGVQAEGYRAGVFWTFESARDELAWYLGIPPENPIEGPVTDLRKRWEAWE
jgi:hypothetical protein